jgi:Glucose/sorbosone dehydrogenases
MSRRAWSALLVTLVLASCAIGEEPVVSPTISAPVRSSASPPGATTPEAPATGSPAEATQIIATGLSVPWGLGFLPDGTALVTLRDRGEVLHVVEGAAPVSVGRVPGVVPGGEGGLLGIAVSPTFASDSTVFVYFTAGSDNRVMRMTFDGIALTPGQVIVEGIAKAANHDGGRLAFGPDGYLYISTGDAGQRDPAQDEASLNGKILRVTAKDHPRPATPSRGRASGAWAIATSRAWPGTRPGPCTPASSGRTPGTS